MINSSSKPLLIYEHVSDIILQNKQLHPLIYKKYISNLEIEPNKEVQSKSESFRDLHPHHSKFTQQRSICDANFL